MLKPPALALSILASVLFAPPASAEPYTPSPTQDDKHWSVEEIQQFQVNVDSAVDQLGYASRSLAYSMRTRDWSATRTSCAGLGAANRQLAATLPGPNEKTTAMVQGLVDQVSDVARGCQSVGPYSTGAELFQLASEVEQLGTYVTAVS